MPPVDRSTISLSSPADARYGAPASCNTRNTEKSMNRKPNASSARCWKPSSRRPTRVSRVNNPIGPGSER